MRVLVVDPSSFTLPYDHCLCEALTRRGCQVTLVRSKFLYAKWPLPAGYPHWESFYSFTHRHPRPGGLGPLWKGLKLLDHVASMRRFVATLRKAPPDIVHFQWLPVPGLDGFFLRRLRDFTRLVLTLHNTTAFHGAPTSRLQAHGFWDSLACFDCIVVHTVHSKRSLLAKGRIPPERVHVVPHGVLNYYRALRAEPDLPEKRGTSTKTVLFFGLLRPYKGVDVLLAAFGRLPREVVETTRLLVVGLPRMPMEPLKEVGKKIGDGSNVVWRIGFVPEEEVASLFEQADVVVLPYKEVDQSGVLMTALGFGKPVIASRTGGFEEILADGLHGFLVRPGDADELAQALLTVLTDPARLKSMGEAVEHLAHSMLSWDDIARQTIDLYQDVLLTRRLPPQG